MTKARQPVRGKLQPLNPLQLPAGVPEDSGDPALSDTFPESTSSSACAASLPVSTQKSYQGKFETFTEVDGMLERALL